MKEFSKKYVVIILALFLFVSCETEKEVEILLQNNNNFFVKDGFVSLELSKIKGLDFAKIAVFADDKEIPSQYIDSNNDGKYDYLNFVIDIEAKQQKEIELKEIAIRKNYPSRTHAEISEKRDYNLVEGVYKGGRFESVQKTKTPIGHKDHNNFYKFEGPGWESDIVGYRFYLDWRNSTDIFGKKVDEMVLPNVGHTKDVGGTDSYHEMADWGMDIFKVGNSLGIGTIAAFENNTIVKVSETDSIVCEISDNGPVTASVTTNYYGWKVEGKSLDLESKIFINAGSRLTHQRLKIKGDAINIATGIAKHKDTEFLSSDNKDKKWNYIALWGKQSLAGDSLGIALFYNNDNPIKLSEDKLSYIIILGNSSNSFDYYYSAVWSGEPDGIKTLKEFKDYCDTEKTKLNNPIIVKGI